VSARDLVWLLFALSVAATAGLAFQAYRARHDGYQLAAMVAGSVAAGFGILLFATSELMADFSLPTPVTVILFIIAIVVIIWGSRRSRWL
jgi:hypothetical protein